MAKSARQETWERGEEEEEVGECSGVAIFSKTVSRARMLG